MKPGHLAIAVLIIVAIASGMARSALADYTSIRKAADAFAAKKDPAFTLWRVDLIGSDREGSPQITEGEFHYFRPLPDQDLAVLGVHVRMLEGMYLPEVSESAYMGSTDLPEIIGSLTRSSPPLAEWKLPNVKPTPVPPNLRSPEEILRRLQGRRTEQGFFLKLLDTRYTLTIGRGVSNITFGHVLGMRSQDWGFFNRKRSPI